jgi:hypothetical protein
VRNYSGIIRTSFATLLTSALTLAVVPFGAVAAPTAPAAPGSIVFSDAPGTSAPPATLGPYNMTAFGPDSQPTDTDVSSVAAPTGTLGFSPSLTHCLIGDCWATWSHGYTGDVYYDSSTTVALTLPASAQAFYFYAEPNEFSNFSIDATNSDGTTSGPIQVSGDSGAEYFGFYSTGSAALTSITVTTADPDGFAIGEFGISTCGYNAPSHWTTNPVGGLTPGVDPLNVVISNCSNVPLATIESAMGHWGTVSTSCISPEQANVAGSGFAAQQQSWRLETVGGVIGSCLTGNILSLDGTENHARLWHQPAVGTPSGAWFVAASYETLCVNIDGTMRPARNYSAAQLLLDAARGLAWHCIDGSQGSIGTDGYNRGARDFVAAIQAAASAQNWNVSVQTISTPAGKGEGAAGTGVPYSGTVYVVSVRTANGTVASTT